DRDKFSEFITVSFRFDYHLYSLQKTGARIKIFSNWAPQSTDRIIQIVGEPAKCIDTIREVITLIKTNPIKGPVSPYDPHNYDDYYADEYGGYGNNANDRRG
ncbi:hypothetical protein AMK59_2734, partial [Oryctes borbonicus]